MMRKQCFLAYTNEPRLLVVYADNEDDAFAAVDAFLADAESEATPTIIRAPAPGKRLADVTKELGMS
jgi:hypothetical protein